MNMPKIDYSKKSRKWLKEKAQFYFNRYIRLRDKDEPCISCTKGPPEQAGHYYPAGQYQAIRYNEDNTNGECVHCNYYSGDHLIKYRDNLIKKIGEERVKILDMKAQAEKRNGFHKWQKFELIEIIEKYKSKCKEL